METAEERQQNEITALKSIYAEDFSEPPPPKAWKDAARLPEFLIKIAHSDEKYSSKIYCHLHTKFPRTYPTIACPTFTIQKPAQGLSNDQITKLSQAVRAEASKHKGSEMVLQIVEFCQEWITQNVVPPVEVPASLAKAMEMRAEDQERAKREREAAEAEEEQEKEARLAEELEQQIMADAQRQLMEQKQIRARHRASSTATVVPSISETRTESFDPKIVFSGVHFGAIKCFQPRKEGLGTIYLAEPVCEDMNTAIPLEVHVIQFESQYYSTSQGMKKLRGVENDIQRLIRIRHQNIQSLLAVKLTAPYPNSPPQMVILCEQQPSTILHDLLEDCESLREERAIDYVTQILSALNVVHSNNLVHGGINTRCIGLCNRDPATQTRVLKLNRVCYHTRLLDLHRSNPFSNKHPAVNGDGSLPEAWLSTDVVDSPLTYTRSRDIHDVGVVFLQMLLGLDVAERYPDPHIILRSPTVSPRSIQLAMNMLVLGKKNQISCSSLLAEFAGRPDIPRSAGVPIPSFEPKTPMPYSFGVSPETEYFRTPPRSRHSSRWKEDWEELELLGKGAFGSVVKARNKIDSRIYAVKKIQLRTMQSDSRIFREVNALSRLSHRFIVRYYTTWVETSERSGTVSSDHSDDDPTSEEGMTSVPQSMENANSDDNISFDLSDLDDIGSSKSSFPSIHFSESSSPKTDDEDDSGEDLFGPQTPAVSRPPPRVQRTLYIQMEFVERQTLKERVAEGLSEDEAWRLFLQIVEALLHMSGLGILHRDIKLANIFIDGKGDCKVGDFGLATSSLVAMDASNTLPHTTIPDADLTLEVGTRLYIAPEVQSKKRGPRNHNKADMYSLGVVFFEMNFTFSTESERIAVIEDLRKAAIIFPSGWEASRNRQRQIITWLLQHDPADRPTAIELSQSQLLPPRVEDEYYRGALKMMSKPDSPHRQMVLSNLFSQTARPSRGYLYDTDSDQPEYTNLNGVIQERLTAIFRLHGAVESEPPLLMPITQPDEEKGRVVLLDRHGEVVALPNNALVPFARLAGRSNHRRIKRYHFATVYRPRTIRGHPKVRKAAVLDIISPDTVHGPIAAGAEILSLMDECLVSFPTLSQTHEIHISHSNIVDAVLDRIPQQHCGPALEIMIQSNPSLSQKRVSLLKKGLPRNIADELEILADNDEDIDELLGKLERVSPSLLATINPAVEQLKKIVQHAKLIGLSQTIFFRPLMIGSHHAHFKGGLRFEVVKRTRPMEALAAGGQYTQLMYRYSHPKPQGDPICAIGVQIAIHKIASALANFQSSSLKAFIKEQRSFGFWSPRRCDVYVVSYHAGCLQDRLEVAGYLWQHNISADLMYESAVSDGDNESHVETCAREGILFIVYPRPRATRRDQAAFKIKNVLKGTEYEVSRPELVPWLQHEIAEQKRVDTSTSGTLSHSDSSQTPWPNKDNPASSDVQLFLPVDIKKPRKLTKQLFLDRAFEVGSQVKTAFQAGIPIFAIDVPSSTFDAMTRNSSWITDDEAWRTMISSFPTANIAYASQLREAAAKRKGEHRFILLYGVKEERVQLLAL